MSEERPMDGDSPERQQQLIEAGRRYELMEVIRETVRSEMRAQFRIYYGEATPEQIREQNTRVRTWIRRWDETMNRFWYGFVATGLRWLLIGMLLLNFMTGNQVFENFLKKIGGS